MSKCLNKSNPEISKMIDSFGEVMTSKLLDTYSEGSIPSFQEVSDLYNKSNEINFGLKSVNILQSDKAKQVFEKGNKNNWTLDKILTELQIPKEQKSILLDLSITDREELITSLLANYSYSIEVNVMKNKIGSDEYGSGYEPKKITDNELANSLGAEVGDYFVEYITEDGDPDVRTFKTLYEAEIAFNTKRSSDNSNVYSNLTVPGGTNYTENEIATPAITPSIKGHAQFSTPNGIGWFRSDEQAETVLENYYVDYVEALNKYVVRSNINGKIATIPGSYSSSELAQEQTNKMNKPSQIRKLGEEVISSDGKTRRILEVQSDLFQKGRDSKVLSKKLEINKVGDTFVSNNEKFTITKIDTDSELYELITISDSQGRTSTMRRSQLEKRFDERGDNSSENQFLQLLNKDNNWVTFFVKSIIQDSAKKGYEKVLFPTGNTASKVEGHTTLEEFKKQKEDRIKFLDGEINDPENIERRIEEAKRERDQIKQELERVEGPEGFGALKPIYNFYENTVSNILRKTYPVTQITDEYGNTWNEVILNGKDNQPILFDQGDVEKYLAKAMRIDTSRTYSREGVMSAQKRKNIFNRTHNEQHKLEVTQIGQADMFKIKVISNHGRPVNPEVQKVLFNDAKKANVKEVLNNIIANTNNPYLKELAEGLLNSSTEYILSLPIILDYLQENGRYDTDGDKITVNNSLASAEHAMKVALHEISHAITVKEYRNNPEFKAKIDVLWKEAKKNMDNDTYEYQLSSGEEFIASIFTNKDNFNKRLAEIKGISANTPNLFQRFLQLLRDFFGFSNISLLDNLLFEIEETGKEQKIREQIHGNNQYDLFGDNLMSVPTSKPINPDDIKSSPKFQKVLQTVRQSLQDRQKELQSQYGTDRIETKSRLAIIKASLGKLSPQAGVYDLLSVSDKDLREAEKVLNKTYEDIDFFELMETKRILLFQSSFDEQLASEDLTEEQEYIIQQQRAKNTKLLHKFNKLITKKLSEASKDFGREITEEDLQKAYKDMSYWNAQTLSLDQSNIPHLQFAKEIINWRKRKTQEDLRNFAKELEELTKKFGEEEFKKIFDAEHLITKYKQEFFDSEREIWAEHHRIMKDPNMSTKDKSASFARVDNFYRDNFTYSLSDKGKQLYEEHKKEFIENNTFINEKGQQEVNQEAVNEWIHENSWESMGRIEKDGTFIFERNTPKTLNINGKIIDSKGWHRYLMKEPIQEHWNPKYDSVKDLEVYKWYTDKAKEIIQKIPHEMTADLDMYDKFLDQITLDLTQSKMDLETIYKGVEETALDWFTVGISLQEARGEDLKLTDEKGRPKPLVKATELKNVKGKSPLEILTKAYSMAVTYEHKVEIQPMLDLLLYQVENLKALPTNRFGIPFANKETAQGLINASNALRFSSSADLTGISRTDEHLGTANISEHERLMLESGEKSIIRKASAVKIADTIVDYSRLTMIGLKPFTAAANLVIGISNNYMYAARKRDFTDKDLDWALTKMFGSIFNFWTMGKLQDKNVLPKDAEKIAMLALNYDIIPENLIEDRSQYGKVSKAFNKITEILFKMQEGGEYLIATQLLLAKMHFTKITDLSGKERTLYDAYDQNGNWKTKEFGDRPEWTELTHKNSEGLNTSKLKIFKDQFEQVRSNTQGDYQNPIQAKSKILGRILFMFRTWLPRSIHSRFGEENTFNNTKGRYISMASGYRKAFGKEGYKGIGKKFFGGSLVVLAKLTNLPLIGQHIAANPIANWAEKEYEAYLKDLGLTDLDIENVRVNIREMQYIALMMLVAMALKGLADDDKNPMLNFSINLAYRTYQDLSFYASPSSAMNIIKDPIPIWKTIQDFNDVVNAGMILITDPSKDTYQKGLHKGDSKFAKELGDMFIISSAWNSTQSTMNQIFNQDAYKYQKK